VLDGGEVCVESNEVELFVAVVDADVVDVLVGFGVGALFLFNKF